MLTYLFPIGLLYAKGEGTPKDEDKALKYTLLAADQGDMQAIFWQLEFTGIDTRWKDQSTCTM